MVGGGGSKSGWKRRRWFCFKEPMDCRSLLAEGVNHARTLRHIHTQHTNTHARTYVCASADTSTHARTHTHTHARTDAHTHTYTCTHADSLKHNYYRHQRITSFNWLRNYINCKQSTLKLSIKQTHTHTQKHMYIHKHTHTHYIHKHTHTHTNIR